MHPGTAVQSDDGGIRACAIRPGQIALNAVARNERAHAPLRGAFKFYALQRCGPCINHQCTYDAPEHQHYPDLEGDCSRQWRLPLILSRSRRANPSSLRVRFSHHVLKLPFRYNMLVPQPKDSRSVEPLHDTTPYSTVKKPTQAADRERPLLAGE